MQNILDKWLKVNSIINHLLKHKEINHLKQENKKISK